MNLSIPILKKENINSKFRSDEIDFKETRKNILSIKGKTINSE